ncbi:MAG: bifunctional adenosylcobinamide kinase/adenosylcobinamide-phosphate guanylyltransferase [Oscillatoriales cyanobacterium SM2_2_1]|nr:bifunctional adenosylcobinamide kinase/adenosylcobinamide-phosphate guanylyltransferase [Oscillatoriales cyanobacterium SM2_2_1]
MPTLTLVTGPSRSGKSEWAEHLLTQVAGSAIPIYIATARCDSTDAEWQARLQLHRDRRPASWEVWEIPVALAAALNAYRGDRPILIDALGTWVANGLDQDDCQWDRTQTELVSTLQRLAVPVILVAEEVGWGLVPPYPAGRIFRDRLGALTRTLGVFAQQFYLVIGGYALDLKHYGLPIGGFPTQSGPAQSPPPP